MIKRFKTHHCCISKTQFLIVYSRSWSNVLSLKNHLIWSIRELSNRWWSFSKGVNIDSLIINLFYIFRMSVNFLALSSNRILYFILTMTLQKLLRLTSSLISLKVRSKLLVSSLSSLINLWSWLFSAAVRGFAYFFKGSWFGGTQSISEPT